MKTTQEHMFQTAYNQSGRVILLDGTSCAGKTSIGKELNDAFQIPFHYVAIDDFIVDLFEYHKKSPLPADDLIEQCNSRITYMYEHIEKLASRGQSILCDTTLICLEDVKSVNKWFTILRGVNGFVVLVYCPFHILVQRIKNRNKRAREQKKLYETRVVHIVLQQFMTMFKRHEFSDEPMLDVLSRRQVEEAFDLLKQELRDDQDSTLYAMLKSDMLQHFGLVKNEVVFIAPKLNYDCIVNTSKHTIHSGARIIQKRFLSMQGNLRNLHALKS